MKTAGVCHYFPAVFSVHRVILSRQRLRMLGSLVTPCLTPALFNIGKAVPLRPKFYDPVIFSLVYLIVKNLLYREKLDILLSVLSYPI